MNKVAVITGGSRGIGWGITKKLAEDGFSVVTMGTTDQKNNAEFMAALKGLAVPYLYVQGNIDSAGDRQRLLDAALAGFGRVDVLVNNAGVAPLTRSDLLSMSEESYDRVVNINLKGTFFLSQLFAKQMIAQQEREGIRGIIVNVGSISANVVSVQRGEYCISKAGIAMMTQLLAARLAPEKVFVYEVRPGIIETRITAVVKEKYDKVCTSDEMLVKRWGQPEDVAEAVSIFCSGRLRYSPGEVLTVDGGFSMRRL